jgi:myosin heavy subunit
VVVIKDFGWEREMGGIRVVGWRRFVVVLLLGVFALEVGVVVRADKGIQVEEAAASGLGFEDEGGESVVSLKTQIRALETGLKEKESILEERDKRISDLQSEARKQQQRTHKEGGGAGDVEAKLEAALSKIKELEAQVGRLTDGSQKLEKEVKGLIKRAESAEKKAATVLSEKERAVKAVVEQESRLRRAEKGLEIAEAAMMRAQAEGEAKAKELAATHKAWLPPWAATHTASLQRSVSSQWSTHGDPVVESLKRSVSARASDAHSFLRPHLHTFNSKVTPAIRERWQQIALAVAPHLETIQNAGASSRNYLAPHVDKVYSTVQPYVQIVKERSAPYVDQAATFFAPHFQKVNTITGPYYKRLLSTANSYHEQLQETVKETMSKNEALGSLATKETVWFLAAALLGLPIVAAFTVIRSLLSGKKRTHHKRHRSSHGGGNSGGSTHKKARRSKQADKLGDKQVTDKLGDTKQSEKQGAK